MKIEEIKNRLQQSANANHKLMHGFRAAVKKELVRQCLEIELEIAKRYAASDHRLWREYGRGDVIC